MSKLVVITGASAGIGLATAEKFYREGFPLLLLDKSENPAFKDRAKGTVICSTLDITNFEAFRAVVGGAENTMGPVECLINNAGIAYVGHIQNQDPKEWKAQFEVNTLGAVHGIKSVVDGMVQRKRGTIINIGSRGDRSLIPMHAAYCSTKYAVRAISESLFEELSQFGIRSILISPGPTRTEISGDPSNSEEVAKYDQQFGTIPQMKASDVAEVIYWAFSQPKNVCIRNVLFSAIG
jgi:NADP-dependent 3-hydroxy acid dehydrogenase YdfG